MCREDAIVCGLIRGHAIVGQNHCLSARRNCDADSSGCLPTVDAQRCQIHRRANTRRYNVSQRQQAGLDRLIVAIEGSCGVQPLPRDGAIQSCYSVASAQQNGKRLIAVVMGLPSEPQCAAEAKRLLQWGFSGFAPFKLFEAGETVGKARVYGPRAALGTKEGALSSVVGAAEAAESQHGPERGNTSPVVGIGSPRSIISPNPRES